MRRLVRFYREKLLYLNSFYWRTYIKIRYPNVVMLGKIDVYGRLNLSINRKSTVVIGRNVVFRSKTKYNFVGLNKPVSIFVGESAKLIIGNNVGMSGTSIYCQKSIEIEDYVNLGGNTSVWDTDFHPLNHEDRRLNIPTQIASKPILIKSDAFIGANSIILKGVVINERVIVGAGSVVVKTIPKDEIWGGCPAVFIRSN